MSKMIPYQLHKASIDVLLEYEEALIDKIGDNGGIYVLYKGKKIYYIGKAIKLKQRIKQHFTDKHKNKWDHFSLYVVSDKKFIPQLERVLIFLIQPIGNKLIYQREIKRSEKELKKAISDLVEKHIDCLFYKEEHKQKTTKYRVLKRTYKGKVYTAILNRDGTVTYNKKTYSSLTATAKKICKYKAISGPRFWNIR